MPYQYVCDFKFLEKNSNIFKNSILIFDEAHNIEI